MRERRVPFYIERPEIINRVSESLRPVLDEATKIISGDQDVQVKESTRGTCVDEISASVVSSIYEGKALKEGELSARVRAAALIGDWLTQPRTTVSFQDLKYTMLCWSDDTYLSARRTKPREAELRSYLIKSAANLKILQRDRIVDERIRYGVFFPDQMWNRIENDRPQDAPRAKKHDNLESLVTDIKRWRQTDLSRRYCPRLGLIFGDFRVGLHPGHHEMMEHAKVALGRDGRLVVITPSKLEIENVAKKSPVWDDEIRLALIANNRYVSDVWLADMEKECWDKPEAYWSGIWSAIKPDLVFLGEVNHPLEPIYRKQSAKLGGILLIDDSIRSSTRSGDLLAAS